MKQDQIDSHCSHRSSLRHRTPCLRSSLGLTSLHRGLNLLDALREFLPVVHDDFSFALLGESLSHLLLFLLSLFDFVNANVSDEGNVGTHGSGGTGLAVLDSQALLGLDTELLASVEVDGRIGLAGRWGEGTGGGVDVFVLEEAHEVGSLQTGNDTGLGRRADDGHGVALGFDPLHLLSDTGAFLAFLGELLGDTSEFLGDIVVLLLRAHGEVVLLLEADEHVAEVVANEIFEQRVGGVAGIDAVFLHDLIGEVRTSLEGQTLRLAQRVVAVEEDVFNLKRISAGLLFRTVFHATALTKTTDLNGRDLERLKPKHGILWFAHPEPGRTMQRKRTLPMMNESSSSIG